MDADRVVRLSREYIPTACAKINIAVCRNKIRFLLRNFQNVSE